MSGGEPKIGRNWDPTRIFFKKQLDMKKASTKTAVCDVPELKRAQHGKGARGKYSDRVTSEGSTVVLQPEIQEVFTTAETACWAVGSMLTLAQPARGLSR